MINNNNSYRLFLLVLLLMVSSLYAKTNPKIKYLTSTDGLSNNFVTDIIEDQRGFLWFTTSDGLNKWDGYNIEIFRLNFENDNSLSSNFLMTIEEDFNGNLWIGTNQTGVIRYNYNEQHFYRYVSNLTNSEAIQSTYIRMIKVAADSTVWIATDLGLSKYNPENDNFKRIRFDISLETEMIHGIYKKLNGDLVFQTQSGIFSYNNHNKSFIKLKLKNLDLQKYLSVPLFFDTNNYLWVGAEDVLIKYNLVDDSFDAYKHNSKQNNSLSSNIISVIFEDSQKQVWIGTKDGGVNLYNALTKNFTVFCSGTLNGKNFSNNIITDIYEDSYKNIWFATQEGGLNYFTIVNNDFEYFDFQADNNLSLIDPKVSSFVEDQQGNVWVGTGGGGIHRYNFEKGDFSRYRLSTNIVSPSILGMVATDNSLYITGWGVGLYNMNINSRHISKVIAKKNSWPNQVSVNIKGIGSDKNGNIWLASHTSEGIVVYNPRENVFFNALNPGPFNSELLSVPYAVTIYEDHSGRIWVVSYSGLFMYDGSFHSFISSRTDSQSISSNYVFAIHESIDSTIWVGNTLGLNKLIETDAGIKFESYSNKYNLPTNIKAILSDNSGRLWFSSNQGITLFNPQTNESRLFQFHKELAGQEFFERSCLKDSKGRLYFGGTNGFYAFNPDRVGFKINEPRIFLTDFKIFNESQAVGVENSPLTKAIDQTDTIVIRYDQNVIGFDYVALNIHNSGNIEYAYKMEGFNTGWTFAGNKRFVTYTNLAPGTYVFRVRTTVGSKINNGHEASVCLIVEPPFWRTTFAYIIYTVAFLLILFFIQMAILYRLKLITELRIEKHKIQNVQETNLMKLRFFTNISHEFRTPLTLMKAPIEKLIQKNDVLNEQERSYHYQLINNSVQKLMQMINQLMDYRKLEAGSLVLEPSVGDIVQFSRKIFDNFNYLAVQKYITYSFNSSFEKLVHTFDADKLDKVLSNLLSNAFKNTPEGGSISFSINLNTNSQDVEGQSYIDISISDSGYGIPEKELPHIFDRFYMVTSKRAENIQGTGIGLALAKELVELHNGNILVKSTENEGSVFVVRLPVTNVSINDDNNQSEVDELDLPSEGLPDEAEVLTDKANKTAKVLIVEDDEELARFLVHELKTIYKVGWSKNGEDALFKAKSFVPDIVISDIMMPVMDGIALCRSLKTDQLTSHIPVVLLTARHSQEKEIEGFDSGADAYVLKPFSLKVLLSRVNNLLNTRKELIEKFKTGPSLNFENQNVESKDQKLIQEIIDLVVDNITDEKLNADFVASKLLISRSLVYIKVEALTGQTVNEFIRSIRLKKAVQMLMQEKLTITEVAYAVGFSSQSYFSRSFAKQFGCSPKEYLKSIK